MGRASLAASRGTFSKKSTHQYGVARVADGPAHHQTYGAQSSSFSHGGGGNGTESGRTNTCSGRATTQGSPAGSTRGRNASPMYSPLDSGPTVHRENTVGDGREFLYLDGISATWHDVQSKDRQSDRRVTCQNSLVEAGLVSSPPTRRIK